MNGPGRRRTSRVLGSIGLLALVAGTVIVGQHADPAQAAAPTAFGTVTQPFGQQVAKQKNAWDDLPTWDEVEKARKNVSTASKQIDRIKALIAEGEQELDRLRNMHAVTIGDLREAEAALADASDRAAALSTQADKSRAEADEAADRAGALVAQMYRSGGVDRSMELFLEADTDTADALLERLASMSKATERNTKLAEEAEQTANTAASLTKQAKAAEAEREKLRQDKQQKEAAAAQAVTEQGELVRAQEQHQADLQLRLEALQDDSAKTLDGYKERERLIKEERERQERAREEARRKAEEEAKRRAEEEAKRQEEERKRQEEQAERERQQQNSGDDGSGDDTGEPPSTPPTAPPDNTSNGWTLPVAPGDYFVSEGYRPPGRPDHTGIDLAAGCGTPIRAAMDGVVSMTYFEVGAGGNMATVNHPNGWQTRYAHMITWPIVTPGQAVSAGQTLGYVGETGMATGCHLHFEMLPDQHAGWWGFVNPAFYINF